MTKTEKEILDGAHFMVIRPFDGRKFGPALQSSPDTGELLEVLTEVLATEGPELVAKPHRYVSLLKGNGGRRAVVVERHPSISALEMIVMSGLANQLEHLVEKLTDVDDRTVN